uniref:Uncharacterized protein n=1 Tax=Helianthus annuus TaxID=4232 RepID=A0A251V579_HELAN
MFWSPESLYYNPVWHGIVATWETLVYNPILDLDSSREITSPSRPLIRRYFIPFSHI